MKKNILYSIGIIGAILLGFAIAWYSKPTSHMISEDQVTHDHDSAENNAEEIYTCSMHPQIRQNGPGQCPICGMDLIPVGDNSSDNPFVLTMTEAAANLSNIQTTVIGSSLSTISNKKLLMTGKVKSDETTASSLVSHLPGRIEKLYISYTGETVKVGQKLIDIYSPELISAQQELLQAKALSNVNPNLLEASKSKLRNWKLTESMIESVLQKEVIQETFTFYAEHSGIVSKRRVSVGDYVKRGEPLFDLINLDKVWVIFDAYEEDLSRIRVGDRIDFTTAALGTRKFTTVVSFIDPVINPQTRTAAIRTETRNSGGLLKPEMFVSGTHTERSKSQGASLKVPKTAVLWTGARSVVYVKVPNADIPSFEYKEVSLGERNGDYYNVDSGLEEGDEVVTNGSFTIDAAAQLNNQASMMNKKVSLKSINEEVILPDFSSNTPEQFKSQISALLDDYMILKEALVETNSEKSKSSSKIMIDNLVKVDMSLLKGEAHMYWMSQLSSIKNHGNKILESNLIEDQRQQFEFLSEALINAISAFGISNKKVFVEFCPMAFNNKGGVWLSYEEKIKNPYFGDKMMTCGVVRDTLGDFVNIQ